MSDFARLNYNLDVVKAQQDARHAAEDGRDLARKRCVEAMARAMRPYWFGESGKAICNYDGQDLHNQEAARKEASRALDAAIASGYVVINKP